jgi:hypothetical protein
MSISNHHRFDSVPRPTNTLVTPLTGSHQLLAYAHWKASRRSQLSLNCSFERTLSVENTHFAGIDRCLKHRPFQITDSDVASRLVPALQYCDPAFFEWFTPARYVSSQNSIFEDGECLSSRSPHCRRRLRWPVNNRTTLLTLVNPESHCDQRRTHGPRTRGRDIPDGLPPRYALRPASSLDCVGRRGAWALVL